uniref:Microfibrillar-associated protein 2 n=1 Tax=Petromyzon marinus TaxID=7757 RepID=A0AAJ7SN68_PETMA
TYNYDYGDITPSTLVDNDLAGHPLPPTVIKEPETTENGCREEQYVCTRLYSINKPCKECIKSLCFYRSLRVYVINKEICVRTVCEQDEIQKAALCKDKFSRCGAMASSGLCGVMKNSCGRSCGDC